jgi:hypothetical protein
MYTRKAYATEYLSYSTQFAAITCNAFFLVLMGFFPIFKRDELQAVAPKRTHLHPAGAEFGLREGS